MNKKNQAKASIKHIKKIYNKTLCPTYTASKKHAASPLVYKPNKNCLITIILAHSCTYSFIRSPQLFSLITFSNAMMFTYQ